ncbi:uncharacterized protein LOC124555929 [Schistocerca americana]|uniref:uncharacterized protein LOC124555929 n=1 Tax=Schistocerca americana TaxID=7009 RepID=UPI001F4FE42C|nr:uncharacterized protein LOC124555929 [Schistocerca americana]
MAGKEDDLASECVQITEQVKNQTEQLKTEVANHVTRIKHFKINTSASSKQVEDVSTKHEEEVGGFLREKDGHITEKLDSTLKRAIQQIISEVYAEQNTSVRTAKNKLDHIRKTLTQDLSHKGKPPIRLIAIIHFLGQQCLPLSGSTDTLFQTDNGNFLKLVELFGKFDTVMMEHLHRTKQGENKGHHYLENETQNEIIHLIGSSTTNKILLMMKSAKYYSIILDCTPDISKVEQMTVVVRFVQETKTRRGTMSEFRSISWDFFQCPILQAPL